MFQTLLWVGGVCAGLVGRDAGELGSVGSSGIEDEVGISFDIIF